MENLKEKTAKGLAWGAVNNGTMQVLNLLIGIVVLNYLTPADTGLIGMLAIFSAISPQPLSTRSNLRHNNTIAYSGLIS